MISVLVSIPKVLHDTLQNALSDTKKFDKMESKLSKTTTTIFTVMSSLAQEVGAINLSQGFPDFEVDQALKDLVKDAIDRGQNQYGPMMGLPSLREKIAEKIFTCYGRTTDPNTEITITTGASQALNTMITALIKTGDEVIVIEPAYDSYIPSILVNGGIPVTYEMKAPDFKIDWSAIESKVSDKTKLLIINTPHNPTGTILQKEDIDAVEAIVLRHGIYLMSDEVYEHLIYDGHIHQSVLAKPSIKDKTIAVFSFGKTFHATGWKVGYIVCPPELSSEFRKIHQFTVFSVNTPVQYALASYLEYPEKWQSLPTFYQEKRDFLNERIQSIPLKPYPCKGTYFQLFDYSQVSDLPDTAFAIWLTKNIGVATIPLSPFYNSGLDQKLIRICFAKKCETIEEALRRLRKL